MLVRSNGPEAPFFKVLVRKASRVGEREVQSRFWRRVCEWGYLLLGDSNSSDQATSIAGFPFSLNPYVKSC